MGKRISRRDFLRVAGIGAGATLMLSACGAQPTPAPTELLADEATEPPAAAEPAAAPTDTPEPLPPAEAPPKVLRFSLGSDIANIDPAYILHNQEDWISGCVYSSLVRYAPNSYELVNDLAESMEQSEDGLTVTFKIREGVQFHKGYGEVTAEDVKFSFERIVDPEVASAYSGDWSALDRVDVLDRYSGQIILKEPFAPLWTTTLPVIAGRIVCKKQADEVGNANIGSDPVGSGPFIFEEWKPKEKVILKRNPDYYGETYLDEIQGIFVQDANASQIALDAAETDFAGISMETRAKYEADERYEVLETPALNYDWIGMNVEHPKLQDINVRQAIRYALDVPAMLAARGQAGIEQATGVVPKGLLGYWADAPKYERDVEKAKGYMAAAGLTSLDLRVDTQAGAGGGDPICEVAQANLAEIGINLTINALDASSYWTIAEGEKGKEIELFWSSFYTYPDPSWAVCWFTCDQVGVWNWMRWCNEEYDELYREGNRTTDPAERERIYIRMQELWDEACHTVWLTWGINLQACSRKFKPAITPNGWAQLYYFQPA